MNKGVHLNTRSARKGFTLLELLLVIVIIAILAALLLPALEKARSRSRQVECLSQLKNTGLAFHGFAHEHQDEFTFQVPMGLGGTLELVQAGAKAGQNNPYTFRHFQALSNELEV